MKIIILILISVSVFSGEFTGAGSKLDNNVTLKLLNLQERGHKIVQSNLNYIYIDGINHIATKSELVSQESIIKVNFKLKSTSKQFKDITTIKLIDDSIIKKEQIKIIVL